jgi:hypothetical protein
LLLANRDAMSVAGSTKPDLPPALPTPPVLYSEATRFMELEREVEQQYRSQMLQALQEKIEQGSGVARKPSAGM